MKSKVLIVIGIILWVIAGLSLVVLVRDLSMLSRIGAADTELLRVIVAYRKALALQEGIAMLLFGIAAYFLTRRPLQRTKPRIALAIGVVVAVALGINASYVFMPEAPALSYFPPIR